MYHSKKIIGDRIKQLRQECGLTQEELAYASDTSASYISRVERGETNLTIDILDRLAFSLNVAPYLLLVDPSTPESVQTEPHQKIMDLVALFEHLEPKHRKFCYILLHTYLNYLDQIQSDKRGEESHDQISDL